MKTVSYAPYYSSDQFQLEQQKLFSTLWVFACSVIDLPTPNSYYLAKMPFGEIIISRDHDRFYAFHNKCLHRGHPLVSAQRGEATFVCPYHNWCYGVNGGLTHIPGDETFYEVSRDDYVFERLQAVAICQLGDFLFINASTNPLPITEQFNPQIIATLEKTRGNIGPATLALSVELDFNWKLIFENLRDFLHPTYLHPRSLTQEVDFYPPSPSTTAQGMPLTDLCEISSFSRDGDLKDSETPYKKDFVLCDSGKQYLNWLLFPFTHIPSPDGGILYAVENYVPVSAQKTRMDLHLYMTKSIGKTAAIPILYDWLDRAKIVLQEDFEAVSAIQRVAMQSEQMQHVGAYEIQNARIHEFLERYLHA